MTGGHSLFLRSAAGPAFAASWSERLLAFVEAGHLRACLALAALSLICFCPGLVSLQPMDRDEPRFAQASKQMIESGDYVSIRFQDEARNKKPVGIHWLQTGVVRAADALGVPDARRQIWLYRLPSLAGALGTILLTYWAGLAFAGRREAFLAAAFMAACVTLMVEARLAKTDAVLTACSVAAMGALARVYLGRSAARIPPATAAIFWLALSAGILIKGPLIVMFAGLCGLVLSLRHRSTRWLSGLRFVPGVVATLLLVSPWFVAIAWKTGGDFFAQAVGDDMLGKVAGAQQQHGAPPGFYLLAFFATFWPAAALAAIAAPFVWRQRGDDRIAFALAWIVPSWLVFEAVPTKLPHYVLPLYPAVAILTVLAVAAGRVGPDRRGARATALLVPAMAVGVTILLCAGAWRLDHSLPVTALPVLLAACIVSGAAWLLFCRHEVTRACLTAVAAAAILSAGAFGLAQPVLASLKLSPRLAAAAGRVACADPAIAALGYREPSLIFLVGTPLRLLEGPAAAAAFASEPGCRVVFVEGRAETAFRAELERRGGRAVAGERLHGFAINGGRDVEVAIYAAQP